MAKYKKRADGRYLTQIQIGIREDGKPQYKNIYAHTVRELEEKAAAFRSELEKGIIVDDKGLTVARWSDEWLNLYKINKSYNTHGNIFTAICFQYIIKTWKKQRI